MAANNASKELQNETVKGFTARISDKVGGGLTCISIAMGIETGLFKVMIALGEPKTSQEIADAGNYKERYVREWLGSMAANDIVEYNAGSGTYLLPKHRHCIDGSVEATALTMTVPSMCTAFFDVAECFKRDGPAGVPYDKYVKFDDLMTGTSQGFFKDRLVQVFLPTMPKVYQQLQQGIQVLEIGCSEGISTNIIAKSFPNSQVYGIDISETGIRTAQESADKMGLSNAKFLCMSATTLPEDWSEKFAFVFMHMVLHDLPNPMETLRETHRVLKIGGTMSVIDTASYTKLEDNLAKLPDFSKMGYVLSMMNCVPTSLYTEGGLGLGAMWGREKAQEMMRAAQFEVVAVNDVDANISLNYQCQKI